MDVRHGKDLYRISFHQKKAAPEVIRRGLVRNRLFELLPATKDQCEASETE